MSLFRDSSEITEVFDKILIWGPTHTGKTHAALSWPDPAVVDLENRDAHFKDRFRFKHAAVPDLETLAKVLKELRSGAIACSSFIFDSYTEAYLKLCLEHTTARTKDGKTTHVTDYTTVNKRDDAMLDFIFSIINRNLLIIAHSAQKYQALENGALRKAGTDFKGQEKFRFAFDYIFRTESQGDPRVKPAKFHVEKSASPNLKVGDVIVGLDYQKFIQLTRGAAPSESATPPLKGEQLADAQATGQLPLADGLAQQIEHIRQIVTEKHLPGADIARVVRDVTAGKTTDYTKVKSTAEAAEIFRKLTAAPARKAS